MRAYGCDGSYGALSSGEERPINIDSLLRTLVGPVWLSVGLEGKCSSSECAFAASASYEVSGARDGIERSVGITGTV